MPSTGSGGRRGGGRRGVSFTAAAAAMLALGGSVLVGYGVAADTAQPPPPPAPAVPPAVPPAVQPAPAPAVPPARPAPEPRADFGPVLDFATPVRLRIPAIGVRSDRIVALGREPDGSLEVPQDFALPGWYTLGPAPGELGPAVIAGHVDSKRGPAVFFRLGALRPGAEIEVSRSDGTLATFTVDRVERHPKDRFPTSRVYGNATSRAELRVITCGGTFDRRTGHYRDNVVAFAHLVRVARR